MAASGAGGGDVHTECFGTVADDSGAEYQFACEDGHCECRYRSHPGNDSMGCAAADGCTVACECEQAEPLSCQHGMPSSCCPAPWSEWPSL